MGRHSCGAININLRHNGKVSKVHVTKKSKTDNDNYKYNTQPCKLGFLAVQVHQQSDSQSTVLGKGTGVQLDCRTFSFEDRHRHTPGKNQMPCSSHSKIKNMIRRIET